MILRELAIDQLEYCKDNSIRVLLKTTDFYRAYLSYANPSYWEYDIIKTIRADPAQFKMRKEIVYEQKYKIKRLVLYIT